MFTFIWDHDMVDFSICMLQFFICSYYFYIIMLILLDIILSFLNSIFNCAILFYKYSSSFSFCFYFVGILKLLDLLLTLLSNILELLKVVIWLLSGDLDCYLSSERWSCSLMLRCHLLFKMDISEV